ncbi:hypothetical protein [Sphingomonas sp. 28-63-12]|uniref:hypothetical protein n=1 Tax=Sphingomonas sp. 28-63-12 TaxID=1970434 RepID=UPI0035A8EBF2
MDYQGINNVRSFNSLYFLGIATIIGIWVFFLRPTPNPDPVNSFAFGCYYAAGAPQIRLDDKGMHVLQTGFSTIAFHLERQKPGIMLVPKKSITAYSYKNDGKYSIEYSHDWYIPFYTVVDNRSYGAFDERRLDGFTVITGTYDELSYRKVAMAACLSPHPKVGEAEPATAA